MNLSEANEVDKAENHIQLEDNDSTCNGSSSVGCEFVDATQDGE